MHTLGERVRVLRPLDKPDYIMLALARSQESHVCAPHHQATASRQPARIVPMVGPWTTRTEHDRAVARAKRATERAQGAPTQVLRRSPPPAQPVVPRAGSADTATQGSSAFLANPDTGRQIPSGLEQSRMGLGAAPIDPLRAGIDPRDPSAPAILRGPAPLVQGGAIAGDDAKIDAAPSPRLAARDAQIATPSKRRQSDWKRNVFRNLSESGP